jgi:NhaA family Na+:H+ antiporter
MTSHLKAPAQMPTIRLIRPFQEFAAKETSGGILLLLCTVVALVWANSPWAHAYTALWHTLIAVRVGGFTLSHDLHFWVNDGLMAVFFFVVGLEIKRELLVGELTQPRQAALPIAAAAGGVIVPALIFAALNAGGPGAAGWGIPMATDIAFVIGVMALLGDRVPLSLKVFLTALAIVDDIGAVLVIAIFYTAHINGAALGLAAICVAVLLVANRLGVRHPLPYAAIGAVLWVAVLQSGVHATIAGVVLALTIPSRTVLAPFDFVSHGRAVLDHFERAANNESNVMRDEELQSAVEAMEDSCEKVQPPLHRLEHGLHPWVTFLIMPMFALANAGVAFDSSFAANLSHPVMLGVMLGLLLGKPIGITAAAWLAVRSKLAWLPAGVGWAQIHGAGWLAGIGFTMSLFVAGLAFKSEGLLTISKIGVLMGSTVAGIVGSALLLRRRSVAEAGDTQAPGGSQPKQVQ